MCRNFSEAGISPTSHRVAVSDEESIGRMIYGTYKGQRFNDVNRLSTDGTGDEDVIVTTLDNLGCTKTVNLLKIDTEGGDLRVLEGARDMLSGQRLDLIQVEAGFSAANTTHVSFQKFNEYLSGYDFHVFGIYQQVNEWPTGNVNLRRADVVYASGKILAANRNTNDDD
jgi:FkbM family methyltransferase